MSIRDRKIWQRIIAICFIIMLVRYYAILTVFDMRHIMINATAGLIQSLVAAFYLLNLLSVILLLKGSRWSTWFATGTIIYSTVFFSVSYFPFIVEAMFGKMHLAAATIVFNAIMAIGLMLLYFVKPDISVQSQNPLP